MSEVERWTDIRATVEGPADSLTALVDRLAAQLLALGAGEGPYRLSALTTTSLPALRAWLNGRAANRKGDYARARDLFDQAIEYDSTFALAGLSRDQLSGSGHPRCESGVCSHGAIAIDSPGATSCFSDPWSARAILF